MYTDLSTGHKNFNFNFFFSVTPIGHQSEFVSSYLSERTGLNWALWVGVQWKGNGRWCLCKYTLFVKVNDLCLAFVLISGVIHNAVWHPLTYAFRYSTFDTFPDNIVLIHLVFFNKIIHLRPPPGTCNAELVWWKLKVTPGFGTVIGVLVTELTDIIR